MGLNRFSVLPEQRVVNTYVPENLNYLAAAGQAKEKSYEEAQAFDESQDGAFGKYAVRDVDIARRDQLHNSYVQQAHALVADKYQGDYGQAMPELRRLAAATASNPFFSHAASALKRQQDMYETEKGIQKKGGTSLGFNRDASTKAVYNEDGTYNNIDYDVQERLDWTKPKVDLMKDIAKDSRISGLGYSKIAGMLESGKFTGVDGYKVASIAKNMIAPYLGTPEGIQEMHWQLKNGRTKEQAYANILSSLGGIGSKQIGQDADMKYNDVPGYVYKLKKADDEDTARKRLLEGPDFNTGMMTNPNAPKQIEMDEKGRPYINRQIQMAGGSEGSVDPMSGMSTDNGSVDGTVRDYKVDTRMKEIRGAYNKVFKGSTGYNPNISDLELVRRHNQAANNSGEISMPGAQLSNTAASSMSKQLLGPAHAKGDIAGLQGRKMMVVSPTGKGGELVTMDDMLKEIGVTKENKITSANVVGRNKYSKGMAGGYTVNITVADKDGTNAKSHRIIVGGSNQEQEFMGQFQPLVDAAAEGRPGVTYVGGNRLESFSAAGPDGRFYHQVRESEPDGKGGYMPMRERVRDKTGRHVLDRQGNTVVKKDANGRTVYTAPKTLDNLTEEAHSLFQQKHPNLYDVSGYENKDLKEQVDASN